MESRKSDLYKEAFQDYEKNGTFKLGPLSSNKLRSDPQYVMFQLARYKHASRLIANKKKIMDIGSGDGVGLPILCQYFPSVSAIDIDMELLNFSKKNLDERNKCDFIFNYFSYSLIKYDAAVSFDVLS